MKCDINDEQMFVYEVVEDRIMTVYTSYCVVQIQYPDIKLEAWLIDDNKGSKIIQTLYRPTIRNLPKPRR